MTAAIYYQADGYSTAGPALMGRNAAGESFLRGFLMHARARRFTVYACDGATAAPFAEAVRAVGRTEPVEVIQPAMIASLQGAGTLYYPGSDIGLRARERSLVGDRLWSICGVTHTTASKAASDGITDLATGATQPWDAVICTSRAVRANVDAVLGAEIERLDARLGATRYPLPQLPVIPLGIHTADFAIDRDGDTARLAARAALGIDAAAVVVLYAGRLSFHAKANPAAMYQALEAAQARVPGRRVVLVECGWFANDGQRGAFDAAAQALCPSVAIVRVDGRERAGRDHAWAAADVFCSLADNYQETFGLTPVEAMAAGLPVVATDWDGYRDTVRHGVDGFLVPTAAPMPGLAADLAARFALNLHSYDRYCAYGSAFVAVDIAAAAEAFAALFASPDLCRRMGAAGRARAVADYDWRVIIGRYEDLWGELAAIRAAAPPGERPAAPWPARMDPFRSFESYPTRVLTPRSVVALTDPTAEEARARLARVEGLEVFAFAERVLPARDELLALIGACAGGPRRVEQVIAVLPAVRAPWAVRTLAWLAKIGVVRIDPA